MSREPDATAYHDDLDDLDHLNNDDPLISDDHEEDPNYSLGYEMGFSSGYIKGYEDGQELLTLEKESAIYNTALSDILSQVDKFDFPEKGDLILVLRLLQRI